MYAILAENSVNSVVGQIHLVIPELQDKEIALELNMWPARNVQNMWPAPVGNITLDIDPKPRSLQASVPRSASAGIAKRTQLAQC